MQNRYVYKISVQWRQCLSIIFSTMLPGSGTRLDVNPFHKCTVNESDKIFLNSRDSSATITSSFGAMKYLRATIFAIREVFQITA
jgi:hypothetical protein